MNAVDGVRAQRVTVTGASGLIGRVLVRMLREDYIIPSVFNRDVATAVAAAVAAEAKAEGQATAEHEIGYAAGETPG